MKFSLKKKVIVVMICISVMTSLFTLFVINKGINDVIEVLFWKHATGIVNLVASEIDSERVERLQGAVLLELDRQENEAAYSSDFTSVEELTDYQALRADLQRMRTALNVSSLNLIWLDAKNQRFVILVDAASEDPLPPGAQEPMTTGSSVALSDPTQSFTPTTISGPEGEKLVSTGTPVLNSQGELIAYATVEVPTDSVADQRRIFLIIAALGQVVMNTIVCFIGIRLVTRFIIKPINKLSHAAELYTSNRKSFSELDISKGDEIGILADSMSHMETEISGYIENLEKITNDLISAREHAKQLNAVANIDPMTQVSNKRAYSTAAARLNDSKAPYALVMVDMNNLKLVNDTCGHEKGDICIQAICRIICQSFPHSPVYRVGGDEFIVILEGDDYRERDTLIRSITETFRENAANTTLPLWERVVGAVGCAVFDPATDRGTDDVLKRADQAMYEQKRAIKGA